MKKDNSWAIKWLNWKIKEDMKNKVTRTTSRTNAVTMITGTKGKFFTVTFKKANGEVRTINGNYKTPRRPNPLGYLNIYSMKDKGYRNVNPQTILSVSVNNTTYKVK